jgi:hypothetical protein
VNALGHAAITNPIEPEAGAFEASLSDEYERSVHINS